MSSLEDKVRKRVFYFLVAVIYVVSILNLLSNRGLIRVFGVVIMVGLTMVLVMGYLAARIEDSDNGGE